MESALQMGAAVIFFIVRGPLIKERAFSAKSLVFTSRTEMDGFPPCTSLGRQRSSSPQLHLSGQPNGEGRCDCSPLWLVLCQEVDKVCIPGGSCREVAWCPKPTCETLNPGCSHLAIWALFFKDWDVGTSLVAQWLRIHLPMQGTQVRALVWEDPTCRGATKPVRHNYWAHVPRACAPQQEKPPQWEARAPQQRVAPAHCN